MLIRNGAYFNCIAGHFHSGVTSTYSFIKPMTMRGWFTPSQNDGTQDQIIRDSFPTGTNPPYSYVMGDKGGLLSSTTTINGEGELTITSLSMGRAIAAALDGSGTITTANLSLIIQMACAILSDGSLSASMVGTVQMASALAGSGDLTASLKLLASVVGSLTGTGSLSGDIRGKASMSADIFVNESTATTEALAAAVWNSLAASFNTAGTMGEKMNDAGSAANPWTEVIESGYTAAEILRILAAAVAGKTSGQPSSPVFRDIADTKDRITATVDSTGNRTAITLDGD